MKAKVLRDKVVKDCYGVIEYDALYCSVLPKLFPIDSTIEGIKTYCTDNVREQLDGFELIEVEIFEK